MEESQDNHEVPGSDEFAAIESELRRLLVRMTYGVNEYDKPLLQLLSDMRFELREAASLEQLESFNSRLGDLLGQDVHKTPEQLLLELPVGLFADLLAAPKLPGTQRKRLLELAEAVVKEKGTLDATAWQDLIQNLQQAMQASSKEIVLDENGAADYQHIEEVLLKLLDMLSVPSQEEEKLEAIKNALSGGVSREQLLNCVHEVAQFIARYHKFETPDRESLEEFLLEMKQNLQDMQGLVSSLVSNQSETFTITNSFGRTLQRNITAMNEQFEAATDLNTLKREIKKSMNQITTSLEQFTSAASTHQAKILNEMNQVNARMNALEIVSEVLKERLLNERKQAMLDPLTGVHNRMAYDERIVDEVERYERYGTPFVLSVWDLDRFKGINDDFGHQAGDKVLQAVAEILIKSVRRVDFVARYGGEEFVLIIPNSTINGAMKLAEKIRQKVEGMHFHHNGRKVEVTISCGLAEIRSGEGVESLFQRADDAMYRAKKGGRNRCLAAE
ncbi:MAG: GGDEF domain-containing protein [Gammaproteobacteria bacterium]|nr:GGDEF domain-containing protein [Gammaproteobacteria bacterium]